MGIYLYKFNMVFKSFIAILSINAAIAAPMPPSIDELPSAQLMHPDGWSEMLCQPALGVGWALTNPLRRWGDFAVGGQTRFKATPHVGLPVLGGGYAAFTQAISQARTMQVGFGLYICTNC